MPISTAGTASNLTAVGGTAVTVTLPSGILGGDCILVAIEWNNGGTGVTCTTPTGYTLLDASVHGAASLTTFFKIAAGTIGAASSDASAVVAATLSVSKAWTALAGVYRGTDTATPIHAHTGGGPGGTGTTHTAPNVTTTLPGCWIVEVAADRAGSTVLTIPTGFTARATAGPAAITGAVIASAADLGPVPVGTYGGDVWTGTVATSNFALATVALKSATLDYVATIVDISSSSDTTDDYSIDRTITLFGTSSSSDAAIPSEGTSGMPEIIYEPYYPGGWEDLPIEDTALRAAAMNRMEDGIHAGVGQANAALETAVGGQAYADAKALTGVASPVTANFTAIVMKHNPADATSGDITATLPAATTLAGSRFVVEKTDATPHAVILSGSLRGVTTILSLTLQHESVELLSDGATWWPISGHKPLSALDSHYSAASAVTQAAEAAEQAPLRRFRVALANRANEPCDVLFVGDSLPAGTGGATLAASYPQVFLRALRAKYPTAGVTGGLCYIGAAPGVYAGNPGAFTDRPVATSGATSFTAGSGAGLGQDATSCVLAASGQSITFTFTGDGFDLALAVVNAAAGTLTLTIDGTAYQWDGTTSIPNLTAGATAIAATAGTLTNAKFSARALSVASHTVVCTWASGSITVNGLDAFNGDAAAGIRLTQACVTGLGSNSFWGTGPRAQWAQWITANVGKVYFPDLIVIDLGINDQGGSTGSVVSSATYKANLQGLIAAAKAGVAARTDGGLVYKPSFLITPTHSRNFTVGAVTPSGGTVLEPMTAYWAAAYEVAAEDADNAVAVCDLGKRLIAGSYVNGTSVYDGMLSSVDHLNYTEPGSDWAGNALAAFTAPG